MLLVCIHFWAYVGLVQDYVEVTIMRVDDERNSLTRPKHVGPISCKPKTRVNPSFDWLENGTRF